MPWTAYKIVFRLLSPMHVGLAKMGNLQTTRPYIHGKALWGALTARITRDTPRFNNDYKGVGEQVNEQLAFSYFYPTTGEDVALWPWDDPERFAWQFLGSYASTALDYSQNSAAEGLLHEVEFIAPHTREGKPVNLVGYIFARDDCEVPWKEALPRLQLGGERTYGWGRVSVKGCPKDGQGEKLFGLYTLDPSASRPLITVPDGEPLLAHTLAVDPGAVQARGRVVPLVGRKTNSAGEHGRVHSDAVVCWEPGSQAMGNLQLRIGVNGIWEANQ